MSERRTIGEILLELGRITEEDVGRALEYQRDHGGYFGEALLACGFVSKDELEFGLASQHDIPYVFPEADAIDPEAAALVSPEWALAHLTLPIMKTEEALTVVVESPIKTRAVDLEAALIRALEASADRFGISTRNHTSWFWWDDAGTVRRRVLEGLWQTDLGELLVPPPQQEVRGRARATWTGQLKRKGIVTPMEIRYLSDESGHEYLFRPTRERSALMDRFPLPAQGILSEIRLLARSGSARFVVTAAPEALGARILPHLPTLFFDPSWRSIYLTAEDREAAGEAFSMKMPRDPARWAEELELLRTFRFDVVTVDLTGNEEAWAGSALDVAAVAFLRWPADRDPRVAYDAGIRWHLHVAGEEGGHLEWTLEPLQA